MEEFVSSLGLDLAGGTLTIPAWAAGVAGVLFAIVLLVAILRSSLTDLTGALLRLGLLAAIIVGGWFWYERTTEAHRAEERRALDNRALQLTTRAVETGSTLACLDATVGESVESACERTVFASPESVAAAAAYVEARMVLLNESHDFVARRDPNYEPALASLRRTIEADRFGLAAQVLASRDGCTAEKCDFFNLVSDPNRLRANLKERTYDNLVARYAVSWPTRPRTAPALSSTTPPPPPGVGSPVPPGFTVPSAASIPPVSIMNAEPSSPPPTQGAGPDPGATPTPAPAPARRPAARTAQPRAKEAERVAPPVQLVPQQPAQ
jgi:hypothetical protein